MGNFCEDYHFYSSHHRVQIVLVVVIIDVDDRPIRGIGTSQSEPAAALGSQKDRHYRESVRALVIAVNLSVKLLR